MFFHPSLRLRIEWRKWNLTMTCIEYTPHTLAHSLPFTPERMKRHAFQYRQAMEMGTPRGTGPEKCKEVNYSRNTSETTAFQKIVNYFFLPLKSSISPVLPINTKNSQVNAWMYIVILWLVILSQFLSIAIILRSFSSFFDELTNPNSCCSRFVVFSASQDIRRKWKADFWMMVA